MKHTPGPWYAVDNGHFWDIRIRNEPYAPAIGRGCQVFDLGNTNLIEAAPDLLEALENLLRHHEQGICLHDSTHRAGSIWTVCDDCDEVWADDEGGFVPHEDSKPVIAARAAIAKAKGEM